MTTNKLLAVITGHNIGWYKFQSSPFTVQIVFSAMNADKRHLVTIMASLNHRIVIHKVYRKNLATLQTYDALQ